MHYKRWTRHGDPTKTVRFRPVEDRFWDKVNRRGACWLWTASTSKGGYGMFTMDGKRRLAHRLAYQWLVGPIADGLQLDHLCRTRHCVNPAHLEPVTPAENIRRGLTGKINHFAARKTHCKRGHPFDEVNTYRPPGGGGRHCLECRRQRHRQGRAAA